MNMALCTGKTKGDEDYISLEEYGLYSKDKSSDSRIIKTIDFLMTCSKVVREFLDPIPEKLRSRCLREYLDWHKAFYCHQASLDSRGYGIIEDYGPCNRNQSTFNHYLQMIRTKIRSNSPLKPESLSLLPFYKPFLPHFDVNELKIIMNRGWREINRGYRIRNPKDMFSTGSVVDWTLTECLHRGTWLDIPTSRLLRVGEELAESFGDEYEGLLN